MVTLTREITGEIGRYRRFTRTAFWIQDENSLHVGQSVRSRPHHGKYVTPLTAADGAPRLDFPSMEWVLQVADEFDDALGALRHRWLGLNAGLGASLAALLKIGRRERARRR